MHKISRVAAVVAAKGGFFMNQTKIKLCQVSNVDALLRLAKDSHGPVFLMDNDHIVCDLRNEDSSADLLRALGKQGLLPEVHLTIPAEDTAMFLAFMVRNAA